MTGSERGICPVCQTGALIEWGGGWYACTSCSELFDPEWPPDWEHLVESGVFRLG